MTITSHADNHVTLTGMLANLQYELAIVEVVLTKVMESHYNAQLALCGQNALNLARDLQWALSVATDTVEEITAYIDKRAN